MKALLKKDIYVLVRQMKIFLLMIAVFAVVPSLNLSVFAIAYCGMLPYTAMAYDERSKWPELAAMMPYTTGDIVLSKYVLGWLATAAASVLSLAAHGILGRFLSVEYSMPLSAVLPSFCVGLIMIALTLPLMFRFGVEKGRMFFVLFIVVLACGGAGLVQGVFSADDVPAVLQSLVGLGVPALAIVLTAVSVPLSARLYDRQQYA